MGWLFWVIIILFFGFILKCMKEDNGWFGGIVLTTILTMAFTFIVVVILVMITPKEKKYVYGPDLELRQINLDSKISGQFILGSGTIEDKPVYYFYVKTGENSYKLDYVLATQSEIFETNGEPKIVYIEGVEIKIYTNKKIFKALWGKTNNIFKIDKCKPAKIYVPVGTIIEDYSGLNLK